jgi:hypothetical protein
MSDLEKGEKYRITYTVGQLCTPYNETVDCIFDEKTWSLGRSFIIVDLHFENHIFQYQWIREDTIVKVEPLI